MNYQKIIKLSALETEHGKLSKYAAAIKRYENNRKIFSDKDFLINPDIKVPEKLKLINPEGLVLYDAENAKLIFEHYKDLTPVQASDARLWSYLAHIDFDGYMKLRFPLPVNKNKKAGFISEHWYLNGINPNNLMRHGIARLWWGAYMTYDETRKNPYELTEELFSMLDYTRTLITSAQGRSKEFTHAVLEFVIENPELFNKYKETKIRFIMKKMNLMGGYNIISSISLNDIKKILLEVCNKYKVKDLKNTS